MLDWIWNALVAPWPDLPDLWECVLFLLPDGKIGRFEVRDLLSVAIAGIGTYLAFLAYGISEKQDKILQEQSRQKARPVLYWEWMAASEEPGSTVHMLYVMNTGDKTLREFDWSVLFPEPYGGSVDLRIPGCMRNPFGVSLDPPGTVDPELFTEFSGRFTQPIWPRRNKKLGEVVIKRGAAKGLVLKWSIGCEDGTFPAPVGMGEAKAVYGEDPIE